MKKLLIGLLVFGNTSAFANCNLEISFEAPLVLYSKKKAVRIVKHILTNKGYEFVRNTPSLQLRFLVSECQDDCPLNVPSMARATLENKDGSFESSSGLPYRLLTPFKNRLIKNLLKDLPNCED